jgi:hypothetical protein
MRQALQEGAYEEVGVLYHRVLALCHQATAKSTLHNNSKNSAESSSLNAAITAATTTAASNSNAALFTHAQQQCAHDEEDKGQGGILPLVLRRAESIATELKETCINAMLTDHADFNSLGTHAPHFYSSKYICKQNRCILPCFNNKYYYRNASLTYFLP